LAGWTSWSTTPGVCYNGESWQVTDQEWDDVFDLNVRALWRCGPPLT
jgi:hypothetical protein